MTSRQLSEWEAYDRIDPIGEYRDDIRLAYLSTLISNLTISVHGKAGARFQKLEDHMIEWDLGKEKPVQRQSVEEMKKALMSLAKSQNSKIKKENDRWTRENRPPKRFRKTNMLRL